MLLTDCHGNCSEWSRLNIWVHLTYTRGPSWRNTFQNLHQQEWLCYVLKQICHHFCTKLYPLEPSYEPNSHCHSVPYLKVKSQSADIAKQHFIITVIAFGCGLMRLSAFRENQTAGGDQGVILDIRGPTRGTTDQLNLRPPPPHHPLLPIFIPSQFLGFICRVDSASVFGTRVFARLSFLFPGFSLHRDSSRETLQWCQLPPPPSSPLSLQNPTNTTAPEQRAALPGSVASLPPISPTRGHPGVSLNELRQVFTGSWRQGYAITCMPRRVRNTGMQQHVWTECTW